MMIRVGLDATGGYRSGLLGIETRERMLTGRWYIDIQDEVARQLGVDRQSITGPPVMGQNLLLRYVEQLAALIYQPPPLVAGLQPELVRRIGDYSGPRLTARYQARGGLPFPSALQRRLHIAARYMLGCNDVGVAIVWAHDRPRVQVVPPSQLRGIQDPGDPGRPIALARWQSRMIAGKQTDTWDTWDLRDPERPVYRVIRAAVGAMGAQDGELPTGEDITEQVIGTPALEGDTYYWRWTQTDRADGESAGEPYIPIMLYHLAPQDVLFDRASGAELLQGALEVAVMWTAFRHAMLDAGWPQRWWANVEVMGGKVKQTEGGRSVVTDPATVLQLIAIQPDLPIQIGQWGPGADAGDMADAISAYEQRLEAQLLHVEIERTGGDPLARLASARSKLAQSLYPAFREYDAGLLEMLAAVTNKATGSKFPESGYSLLYADEIEPQPEPAKPPTTPPSNTPTPSAGAGTQGVSNGR